LERLSEDEKLFYGLLHEKKGMEILGSHWGVKKGKINFNSETYSEPCVWNNEDSGRHQ